MRGAALALSLIAGGCLQAPEFACSDNSVCVLNNVQGTCDVPTSTCVYPGPDCPSLLRDGHGNCVDTTGPSTTDPTTADVSVSATMSTTSDESGEEESTDGGEMSTSEPSTGPGSTTGSMACTGSGMNITDAGVVGASTVFEGYPPILSADGDLTTSWFSTGPDDASTAYSWTLSEERCIDRITITGNGQHANPGFREGFGFGAVRVNVLDQASRVVFTQMRDLEGTPDPAVVVMTGGVSGSRIVLEFTGHENVDCGGFSELEVVGE